MDINIKIYFQINPNSGVPIYRQVIDQVKIGIATGRFKPGEYLPSVREVSSALEINPMTVSKAYSLLEKNKIVEFIRGQGMRVPDAPINVKNNGNEEQMKALLREVVNCAQQWSLTQETVLKDLKQIWEVNSHGQDG